MSEETYRQYWKASKKNPSHVITTEDVNNPNPDVPGDYLVDTLARLRTELSIGDAIAFRPDRRITTHQRYERNPCVFKDSNGKTWLFYARSQDINDRSGADVDNVPYNIYYQTSTDDGKTWTDPVLFGNEIPAGHYQREFGLVEPQAGHLWLFVGSGDSGDYRGLHYYKSIDGGANWSGATKVLLATTSDDPNNVLGGTRMGHIDVKFFGGKFYLVYQASGGSAVYFSRSDDGATWIAPVQIYASGQMVPKMCVTAGKIYVVSSLGASGEIHLATSVDDGDTWTPAGYVCGSQSAWTDWDPVIAKLPSGKLMIVWAPNVGSDGQQLRAVFSVDDGVNWSADDLLTMGYNAEEEWWDYWPQVVIDDSAFFIYYTSEKDYLGKEKVGADIWRIRYDFKPESLRGGTTAQRPANPQLFQQYFDTTVGLPVWWNGTAWQDAAGNAV
jgi:hypothetical protein